MTKTYFISGHLDLTAEEFKAHYEERIARAVRSGARFVVGDARGADSIAQLSLMDLLKDDPAGMYRVAVYHMLTGPRINHGNFSCRGGFTTDKDRDARMTADSDEDIAWVRPGREASGTAANLRRRGPQPVPPRSMLQILYNVESGFLRKLNADPTGWNTLDIMYEPPRVERLWRQIDDEVRVFLHRIHPCDKALFHPHPWPSAVHVLSGSYWMEIGFGAGQVEPRRAATTILEAGSRYEMVDPDGWHSVRPVGAPSLSVMVTARPWKRWSPKPNVTLSGLPDATRDELLTLFDHELRRVDYGGKPDCF